MRCSPRLPTLATRDPPAMPFFPAWARRRLVGSTPPGRAGDRKTTATPAAAPLSSSISAPVPPPPPPFPTPPPALWAAIVETYAQATASGAVCRTDTAASILPDGGWGFVLRSAAATLAAKDKAGRRQGSAPSSPARPKAAAAPPPPTTDTWFNPFSPPDPRLVVLRAPAFPPTHILALNKFNLAPHHTLVITSCFERQEAPLTPGDLGATWAVLDAYPGAGGLAYFNRGPGSGASQPHKHLQVVPLPLDGIEKGGGAQTGFDGAPSTTARAPFEGSVLEATVQAALYEPVPLRSLPFRAWGARLPGGRDAGGSQPSPAALAACVSALATAAGAPPSLQDWTPGDSLAAIQAGRGPGGGTASWNLALTRRCVLVVARPPPGSAAAAAALNLNAIAYAGSLYARGPADMEAMARAGGPMGLLAAGGVGWG